MRGRLSDPQWKSGPTHNEPTDSEHALDIEPAGIDIDGVGVDEAERVDGTPICTTQEGFVCHRDMCDEMERRRHIYVLEDVPSNVLDEIAEAIDWNGENVWPDDEDIIEYIAVNAEVIDYDEAPVLGVEGTDLYLTKELTITEEAHGPCYGEHEPDWEEY